MENFKSSVLFMTIVMVLSMLGCPGGGTGGTGDATVEVNVQAPCPKSDLAVTIDDIKNNGRQGTYWNIEVSYTVKCDGEAIAADLYIKLAGFSFRRGQSGADGTGAMTFTPSSDPTGSVVTAKIYGNDDAQDPAQTITGTVPGP